MGVELWLIRHGETEWSLDGRHTSTTDIPLTEHGRQRALELKAYLAGKKFAAVFVSPRQRALETCKLAGYGDVAVVDDGLQEWNYGDAEGKTTAQMRELRPGWSVWTSPIVGGESVEEVGVRADGVIARAEAAVLPTSQNRDAGHAAAHPTHDDKAVTDGAPNQCVALFAHAHILRILAARWVGLPPTEGHRLALSTGSLSVLGHERETRVIQRWNRSFEE
jgi:probable phosphoglycerate mutase